MGIYFVYMKIFPTKILHFLISITSIVVIPVQIVTTFVLGLIFSIPIVGLILLPLSLVWMLLFMGPLFGLSYLYEKVVVLRPFVAIIGIPIALVGDTFVALIPSMGEKSSRFSKMVICQTFPYSWSFLKLQQRKLDMGVEHTLHKILKEVSKVTPLKNYLKEFKADVITRPSYTENPYTIEW